MPGLFSSVFDFGVAIASAPKAILKAGGEFIEQAAIDYKAGSADVLKAERAAARGIKDPITRAKALDRLKISKLGKPDMFDQRMRQTRGYKTAAGIGKFGSFVGRAITRNPLAKFATTSKLMAPGMAVIGAGVGLAYGGTNAVIQRLDARTQQRAGMSGNNLGTDGLTLALSRRRHR